MSESFKNLDAWKMAFMLTKMVYTLTAKLPSEEKFGLVNQMRRAAVSTTSNIAEGAGRNSKKEFAQFLGIAYGSCCELETQMLLVQSLYPQLLKEAEAAMSQLASVGRLVKALQRSMNKQPSNSAT